MRTAPLGPSVELPLGPRNAVLGGGDACGLRHWDLRWSSLWGHETLSWMGETHANCATGTLGGAPYGATNAVLGGGDACKLRQWGLRWAHYGATKRCPGWGRRMRTAPLGLRWSSLWGHATLYWVGETHASCATGTSVELPMGPRNVRGCRRRVRAVALTRPSVELPMVSRKKNCERFADMGVGDSRGRSHWEDLRLRSPWGYETCEGRYTETRAGGCRTQAAQEGSSVKLLARPRNM